MSNDSISKFASTAIGIVVAIAFISGIALSDDEVGPVVREILLLHWRTILIWVSVPAAILIVFLIARKFFKGAAKWLSAASDAVRALIVTTIGVPVLVVVVYMIGFANFQLRGLILEVLFVVIAAILPAAMYYLFISTRRPSLFDEYLTNLSRLGLLPKKDSNTSGDKRRIDAYIQKFEATYGLLSSERRQQAISEILNPNVNSTSSSGNEVRSVGRLVSFQTANLWTPGVMIPIALATILIGSGWVLVLPPGYEGKDILYPVPTPLGFGFLGAYFFSLNMIYWRYVRRDLRPSVFIAIAQRLVLTTIAVWVLITLAPEAAKIASSLFQADQVSAPDEVALSFDSYEQLYLIAFLIGISPRVFWDFLTSLASKITGAKRVLRRMEPDQPLSDLDGLSFWHESRLEEEDIENVTNMATADIVELMLNTQFPPQRIVDWVDQSILYTAIGPDAEFRAKLREHSVRTASALLATYSARRGSAREAFETVVGSPGEPSPILGLFNTLETNPNLVLVRNWQKSPVYTA